jgi:hypothetical protein
MAFIAVYLDGAWPVLRTKDARHRAARRWRHWFRSELIWKEARIVIAFSRPPVYGIPGGSFDPPLGAVDHPLDDAFP